MKPLGWINGAWLLAVILGLMGASGTTQATPDIRPPTSAPQPLPAKEPATVTKAKVQAAYDKLPLHFEANQGQTDAGEEGAEAVCRLRALFLSEAGPWEAFWSCN